MGEKKQKKKHNIIFTTLPKQQYTDDEVKKTINKAINLIIDELIINEHIKVGNC